MISKQNPKGLLKYVPPLLVSRIFFPVVFELSAHCLQYRSFSAIALVVQPYLYWASLPILSHFTYLAKLYILSKIAHLCPHAHFCQLAHVEMISSHWAYIKPTQFSVNLIVLSIHEPGDKVVSICAFFEDLLGSLHIFLNKLAHLWANVLDYKILGITFLPTCSNMH